MLLGYYSHLCKRGGSFCTLADMKRHGEEGRPSTTAERKIELGLAVCRKEVNTNGKHPQTREQLPFGGVHGYDPEGHRRKPQQKTVHPPEGLTPKAKEKWLEEEAALFERQCKNQPLTVDKSITLAEYTAYWLAYIAPGKLAKSTLARDKQDIDSSCLSWAATNSPN